MLRRRRKASDFQAETEAHIELEAERLEEAGLSADEARAAARRAFGNLTQAQERFYEAGGWAWWSSLWQDVRFGLRMLAKTPGFTAVAVLTLALGIGATTAIFSAVYAVLLKPLPYRDPGRLVFVEKKNPPRGWTGNNISPVEILEWREQSGAFEDLAAYKQTSCVLSDAGPAEEYPCEVASSNLFPLLGATPLLGRPFRAEEDRSESAPVAILSYALWQRRFGGDAGVLSRVVGINRRSYKIVGVMPAGFSHLYGSPYGTVPALWLGGIALSPAAADNNYFGVGRLRPGISRQQAEAQTAEVSLRIEAEFSGLKGWRAQILSIRDEVSGDTGPALLVLMGAVIFVLLIACANLANLLLARSASRSAEFAVRTALGAGRARMVRQFLTESLLLAVGGGGLGVLLAVWGCQGMAALAPQTLRNAAPGLSGAALDWRVLAFALFTVAAATLLFGLAPAFESAGLKLAETLKEHGRGHSSSSRFRGALVVAETALAVVLLGGAGLMVRTFAQLSRVNMGFDPHHILTLRVPFTGERYAAPEARANFWERLVAAVSPLPGVESASASRGLPINGWAGQFFTTFENPNPQAGHIPDANYVVAGPDYFRTLRIPLRRGRVFNAHDNESGARVAIINEELARLYWPGRNPIGNRLRPGSPEDESRWLTVVGVVGNVHSWGPDGGFHAEIYVPYRQFPWLLPPDSLLVKTAANVQPEELVRAVTREVRRIDAGLSVADVESMEQMAREPMAEQRMVMALMVAFGGLALVLSALGTYSVLSFSMAQRTREIGLRMALGAQRGNVLGLVVGGGVRLTLAGIAVGLAGALALTRLMKDLLFGVGATDPLTLGTVIVILMTSSLAAAWMPARRAILVDPVVALRHE